MPKLLILLNKIKNTAHGASSIRHLVNLYYKEPEKIFSVFSSLALQLPLVQMDNYSVYYKYDTDTAHKMLFDNSILLTTSYGKNEIIERHWWIVLSEEGDSSCVEFSDEGLFSFVKNNFTEYEKLFGTLFLKTNTDAEFMRRLTEWKVSGADTELMIKSDPCRDVIPAKVYQSMKERCLRSAPPHTILFFANTIPTLDFESAVDYYIEYEIKRYELTRSIRRLNIFSAKGLRDFTLTGRLSDHISDLPLFSKEEVLWILRDIYNRNLDPNDGYRFYISRAEIFNDWYALEATSAGRINVEALYSKFGLNPGYVSLEYKPLTELLFKYVENWLIPYYTMSEPEMMNYMTKLMEEVENQAPSGDAAFAGQPPETAAAR
ncbi:MAG: hypothetical protein LBS84_10045 [Clostridiales bacterium]|nr:hypothetical protein [Clostridiales bacterium]